MRSIAVASYVKNVIDNLRSSDPRLKDISDWRIDLAHREYSVSEDFGDDLKVFDWLPDDTEDNQWKYVNDIQMGDLKRTIRDLERYNADLSSKLRDANKTVRELSDQAHGGV